MVYLIVSLPARTMRVCVAWLPRAIMPRCLSNFTGNLFMYPTYCNCPAMSKGARGRPEASSTEKFDCALKFDWLIKTDGTDLPIGYTDGIILSENDENLWNPDKKIKTVKLFILSFRFKKISYIFLKRTWKKNQKNEVSKIFFLSFRFTKISDIFVELMWKKNKNSDISKYFFCRKVKFPKYVRWLIFVVLWSKI